MKTILHIASSSNLQSSVTRQIGAAILAEFKAKESGGKIITRDLVQEPVPHISPGFLGAMFAGKTDAPELALSEKLIQELLSSDVIVLECPMYNFSIPSALKAWIDNVVRAGKTFTFGANGPEGLVKGKKVILVIGRGGVYTEGPTKPMDFQEPYLRMILGFIGITDVQSIFVEGVAKGPDVAKAALDAAKQRISTVVDHVL